MFTCVRYVEILQRFFQSFLKYFYYGQTFIPLEDRIQGVRLHCDCNCKKLLNLTDNFKDTFRKGYLSLVYYSLQSDVSTNRLLIRLIINYAYIMLPLPPELNIKPKVALQSPDNCLCLCTLVFALEKARLS